MSSGQKPSTFTMRHSCDATSSDPHEAPQGRPGCNPVVTPPAVVAAIHVEPAEFPVSAAA
jgi:hypothetical protein